MEEMTLREIHLSIGVTRRAVQGYEKAKLVSATGKTDRGYLLYDRSACERIKKIKLFQEMGFSIKEIQIIIDSSPEILKSALIEKEKILKEKLVHTNKMISIIHELLETL